VRTAFAVIGLTFATGCLGGGSATRGIEQPPKMIDAITSRVPVGTPVDDAQRFMEREGFTCSRESNADFRDRKGLDYIYCRCDRPLDLFVSRGWMIAIVHRDGKVTEVLANTELTGP
jgi:hypothetical protein